MILLLLLYDSDIMMLLLLLYDSDINIMMMLLLLLYDSHIMMLLYDSDCEEHPATRICDGSGTDAEAGQYDLTKEQCSSLCWNSPTCVAWTFHSKGACYTKQGDFQCVQASEDWVWGTKKCGDPNN